MNRLITDVDEQLVVLRMLFNELKESVSNGKCVIFPPDTFVLPEGRICIDKSAKPGEKLVNFSYKQVEKDISAREALRLLGATIYHLACGKSEFNRESFALDGYRQPLDSNLWPVVSRLLGKKGLSMAEAETMIGAIDPESLKMVIKPPLSVPVSTKIVPPVDAAYDILDELANKGLKVLRHEKVAEFWGIPLPENVRISYSRNSLNAAIADNLSGQQWILAYYTGQSIDQMMRKRGFRTFNQPCFYVGSGKWLEETEKRWREKKLEPGYYLLNFNVHFNSKNWYEQEEQIADLSPVYERAHEAIVVEAVLSNYRIRDGERLLKFNRHCGRELDSQGNPVLVGYFDTTGIMISSGSLRNSRSYREGVVIARKFDPDPLTSTLIQTHFGSYHGGGYHD